jgi:hypothetical protein
MNGRAGGRRLDRADGTARMEIKRDFRRDVRKVRDTNLDAEITKFVDVPIGYEADAKRVAGRRGVLAGYRLAEELKRLFNE